jgi:tetratricopeptide (TPR) repeat protein
LQTVGQYYSVNESNEEAWPYFRKAEPVLRRELPPDHFRRLHLNVQLATCYRDAGDFPPAYRLLNEAVALTRRKAGERDADFHRAHALRFLAGMYRVERRFTEARETIAEWRQALAPHHAASHQLLFLADFQEALLFRGQARLSGDAQLFEQAIAGFAHVLEVQSKALPEEHIDTVETRLELARTHFYAGHTNDAVRLILDAYQAAHRKVGPDHQFTRRVLAALEQIREATGRPELDAVGHSEPTRPTR